MNKTLLVALLLLVAGAALALNSLSVPSLLSEESRPCPLGGNCTGNSSENCISPSGSTCQENVSQENCSEKGSCPLKAVSKGAGVCRGRCSL